jgi:hypothetical protein
MFPAAVDVASSGMLLPLRVSAQMMSAGQLLQVAITCTSPPLG